MLCCHSLFLLKEDVQGTAIEKQMFDHVGGKLIPDDRFQMVVQRGDRKFNILKSFEFTSETQRMSVIAEHKQVKFSFVKGAPEVIAERCIPSTLGDNLLETVEKYS